MDLLTTIVLTIILALAAACLAIFLVVYGILFPATSFVDIHLQEENEVRKGQGKSQGMYYASHQVKLSPFLSGSRVG